MKALEGQDALYDFFGLGKVLTEFETYRLAMKKWAWQKTPLLQMEQGNIIVYGGKKSYDENYLGLQKPISSKPVDLR